MLAIVSLLYQPPPPSPPSIQQERQMWGLGVSWNPRPTGCWHARLKIFRFFRTVKFYKINFWLLWISSILFYKSFHVWVISNSSDNATFFSKEKYFLEQNKQFSSSFCIKQFFIINFIQLIVIGILCLKIFKVWCICLLPYHKAIL